MSSLRGNQQPEENEHQVQTLAKTKEQERLNALPEPGLGRKCFKCGMSVWHNDFEQHMNDHFDYYNNGMGKYVEKIQKGEAKLTTITNTDVFDQDSVSVNQRTVY